MTTVAQLKEELVKASAKDSDFVCVVDSDGHLHQFEVECEGGVVKLVIA